MIYVMINEIPFVTFSLLLLLLLFQPVPSSTTPSSKKATASPLSYGVSPVQPLPQTSTVPSNMYTPSDNQTLSSPMPHTSTASKWTNRCTLHRGPSCHGTVPSALFAPKTICACSASSRSTNTSWQTSGGGSSFKRTPYIHW